MQPSSSEWIATPSSSAPVATADPHDHDLNDHQDHHVLLPHGEHLYLHRWVSPDPVGSVMLLHGKGDYGGRFEQVGTRLSQSGWSTYAPDMPGFGRSPGKRGWIRRFAEYLQDLESVQAQVQAQLWGGYSTGANLAVEYALQHPDQVRGLILVAPAFRIDHSVTPWKYLMLQVVEKILPDYVIYSHYTPSVVTSDPDQQEKLAQDPWMTGMTRARFVAEIARSGRDCIRAAGRLTMPILVIYSPNDRVVNSAGVIDFAAPIEAKGGDITLLAFPESRHDLLHDISAPAIETAILEWISKKIPH